MRLRRELGQPKVENLRLRPLRDKDVGRFGVTVDDRLRVRRIQRIRDLNGKVEQHLCSYWLAFDQMLERLAFQKLHRNERSAFVFTDVVNGADVGMIQGGGSLSFALETFQ